jgi:hypothetical protein
MKNLSKKTKLYIIHIGVRFISCTSKKKIEIVMDKEGNYYELTHKNAFMGAEMYGSLSQ